MENQWKKDLELLTQYGKFGFYKFAEVKQIVLIDNKTKKAWNFFTNITFSKNILSQNCAEYITDRLEEINKHYKLAISKYTLPLKQFKELYRKAVESQSWYYEDEKIDSPVYLDNIFPTEKKYIPEFDPRGGKYKLSVPIAEFLYGSNYLGNYYIMELYSTKDTLKKFISKEDINIIQKIIEKYHLEYRLDCLYDRIGNIVCKFEQEIVNFEPKRLNDPDICFKFWIADTFIKPNCKSRLEKRKISRLIHRN